MKKPILTLSLVAKKLFLSLLVIAALNQTIYAQEAPNLMPPSPQSEQFFKHFDFPANNPNGTINYSIPIYEVKSGSLSMPVSLSYVSGGSKVSDETGEIGLGWSVNAGGRIARTIYGKPDEARHFPADTITVMNNADGVPVDDTYRINYLNYLYQGDYFDSEFDIFSYSFNNTSGKFLYKQYDETGYNPKAYLMPEKPYKIDGPLTSTSSAWTIVDDKGITYIYDTEEQCKTSGSSSYGAPTAKYLNYMISADKKDTIRIEYQIYPNQIRYYQGSQGIVQDNNTVVPFPFPATFGTVAMESMVDSFQQYDVAVPKNIYFKGGKIAFLFDANGRIEYIKIYDKKNTLVKQFQLVRTTVRYSKQQLSELRLQDNTGTTVEKYSFEYYPFVRDYTADYFGYLKDNGSHVFRRNVSGEYWIYDDVDGTHPYPGHIFTVGTTPYEGYISDEASMWGMLKKVTYPTGGSAEYSYGQNSAYIYGVSSAYFNAGGMRLTETKLTDNNGNVHYKTYTYGITGEEGYGVATPFNFTNTNGPDIALTAYQTRVFATGTSSYPGHSYRKRVYTSSFLPEIAEAAQEPTFYPTVTVYDGTPSSNTGKTVYKYNGQSNYTIGYYPADDYFGSTGSYYGYYDMEWDWAFYSRPHIYQFDPWRGHPLASTTVFKNNGSGYDTVKTIGNCYNTAQTKTFMGLHILKNMETNISDMSNYLIPVLLYDNYYVTTGREDLVCTTETLYTPSGNVTTTTNYEYNDNYQVNKSTATESKGGTNITTYTYATDYPSAQPYTAMVTNNMISQPVEVTNYKNSVSSGNFLQSVKTDYAFWYNGATTGTPNNSIYPEKVWTKKLSAANPYVLALQYDSYDESSGNILQLSKAGAAPTSYIWGYNKQYPVLEVKNATYSTLVSTLGSTVMNLLNDPNYDSDVRSAASTLRSSLPASLVTGISYRPLVGTTSTTDPKGLTTYYEYDTYQRLMNIKDKDGNIVKHTDYNYQH